MASISSRHLGVCRLFLISLIVVCVVVNVILLSRSGWTRSMSRKTHGNFHNWNSLELGVRVTSPSDSDLERPVKNRSLPEHAFVELMSLKLHALAAEGLRVTMTADEFRQSPPDMETGNPLIDAYRESDRWEEVERGWRVALSDDEKNNTEKLQRHFNVNVKASDVIPLNRVVPDSRLKGGARELLCCLLELRSRCSKLTYEHDLPTASVIVPFYDEWPSILLRTVYSIVNRTPRHLLQEIILIDDSSTMEILKLPLQNYIDYNFPRGLVRLLRAPSREGLIRARMRGWAESKGDVVVFFDSHMEVNIDWLQPLLVAIKADRHTVAMASLDYVNRTTLEYEFYNNYIIRYGFDWTLNFFENYFRNEQIGHSPTSPRLGVVMVGSAFAMDRKYFEELGGYDTGMKVWGGENLEMSWRVWMCGGRLLHIPCSHIGHIARVQPYTFQEGRYKILLHNYKRAAQVWMGPYIKFVYDNYKDMQELDVGDLSDRIALRNRLGCQNFTWYLDNVWPEMNVFDRDVIAWGSLVNIATHECLDTHDHIGQSPNYVFMYPCHYHLQTQGFSFTKDGRLRSALHCLFFEPTRDQRQPTLNSCLYKKDKWHHTKDGFVKHISSGLCMDEDANGPVMKDCNPSSQSQKWYFTNYVIM